MENYWDKITKIAKRQEKKGVEHYGQTLEENCEMGIEERLVMLEEELVDALKYTEHIKIGISDYETRRTEIERKTIQKVSKLISNMVRCENCPLSNSCFSDNKECSNSLEKYLLNHMKR